MISQPVEVDRDHSGLRVNLQRSTEDAGSGLEVKMDETRRTDHPPNQCPTRVMIKMMLLNLVERKMMMLNLVERKAQPRRAGKSDTDGEELRIGIAADTGEEEK